PRAGPSRLVVGVQQPAAVERQAAAADAAGQLVAQALEGGDAGVEALAPRLREPVPVGGRGRAGVGQPCQHRADLLEGDAAGPCGGPAPACRIRAPTAAVGVRRWGSRASTEPTSSREMPQRWAARITATRLTVARAKRRWLPAVRSDLISPRSS